MNEQEVIDFMVNNMNEDNRVMSKQAGYTDEQIEKYISQSIPTMQIMMANIVSKLKEQDILKLEG